MRYAACSSDLVWPASAPVELSGTTQLTSVVHVKASFGEGPMTMHPLPVNRGRDHLHGHGQDSYGNPAILWL